MLDRRTAIRNLDVGDIFHAECDNGASAICLTTSVTQDIIHARTVTTQFCLAFDRQTGVAKWGEGSGFCSIDSVAPLPPDIHEVMLGIDRKYRLRQTSEGSRLLEAEIRALLFIHSFYPSNPV